MKEIRQRSRFRKMFFSLPVLLFFLAVCVFFSVSLLKIYKKSRNAVLSNESVIEEIGKIEKREKDLSASINQLRGGFGAEKELREKFNVKKPGEEFVVIIDNSKKGEEDTDKEKKDQGFFKKVLELLKF